MPYKFRERTIYYFGEKGSGFHPYEVGLQKFEILRDECLDLGTLFEDPTFDCTIDCVYFSPEKQNKFKNKIEWERPLTIAKGKPRFFASDKSNFDIHQGLKEDSWFLSSLANLAHNRDLMEMVVPDDQSFVDGGYAGIFHFRFCPYGRWVDIVVDDRLPTKRHNLLFIQSEAKKEFWCCLLEKALAKLKGSYEALNTGASSEALRDFTGGVLERFVIAPNEQPENFKNTIIKSYERSSLMCAAINSLPQDVSAGLQTRHVYFVSMVYLLKHRGETVLLLRFRNPWGNDEEWQGDWSDDSPKWNDISQAVRRQVELYKTEHDEFWMSYDEFVKYFHRLNICQLDFDRGGKCWEVSGFDDRWVREVSAGGPFGSESYYCNPQFIIKLVQPDEGDKENRCAVIVGLTQKGCKRLHNKLLQIKFDIFHLPADKVLPTPLNRDFFHTHEPIQKSKDLSYTKAEDVTDRYHLQTGTYCIVPSTYAPDEEAVFFIRVVTEKKSNMKLYETNISMKQVKTEKLGNEEKEYISKIKTIYNEYAGEDGGIDWTVLQSLLNRMNIRDKDSNLSFLQSVRQSLQSVDIPRFFTYFYPFPSITNVLSFTDNMCRSLLAMVDFEVSGNMYLEEFIQLWIDIKVWTVIFRKRSVQRAHHRRDG